MLVDHFNQFLQYFQLHHSDTCYKAFMLWRQWWYEVLAINLRLIILAVFKGQNLLLNCCFRLVWSKVHLQCLNNWWKYLQVFVIELVTFAVDFVPLAVEFDAFAIEFVGFAVEFVALALQFVALAIELDASAMGLGAFALELVVLS